MSDYTIDLKHVCDIYGRDEVESWFMAYDMNDYLSQEQISKILENTKTSSKNCRPLFYA